MRPPVLIVDDDPDIRESLTDMLGHEGYLVHSAASGTEALQQAKQTRYDAALLDIQLPDLNGLQRCARHRRPVALDLSGDRPQ